MLAYACLRRLNLLPSQFVKLSIREKMFLLAAFQKEAKEQKELEKK